MKVSFLVLETIIDIGDIGWDGLHCPEERKGLLPNYLTHLDIVRLLLMVLLGGGLKWSTA